MAPTPARRHVVLVLTGSATTVEDLRRVLDPLAVDVRDDGAAGPPDVVVVDLDRVGALDPELGGLPVLALVRRDAPEEVPWAMAAGALDVLAVPLADAEVAARVLLAARLSEGEARLHARNAELAAWAARAGHDLMTPLAVISGMAETLEASWDRLAEADRARLLASIQNQAARARAMLEEALALARQDAQLTSEPSDPP